MCLNNKSALKTRVYEDRYAHKGKYFYVIESCSYCRLKNSVKEIPRKWESIGFLMWVVIILK